MVSTCKTRARNPAIASDHDKFFYWMEIPIFQLAKIECQVVVYTTKKLVLTEVLGSYILSIARCR